MNNPLYIHLSPMSTTMVEGEEYIEYDRHSHWFGYPVMPEDFPLPQDSAGNPLGFICQIDCREIPAEENKLPHEGMLYIFADLDYYAGVDGDPMPMYSSADWIRVIYLNEKQLVNLSVRDDDRFGNVFEPVKISLNYNKPTCDEPEHHLLGEPEHREWDDWDKPYGGWRLLFQMDSCDGSDYHFNFLDWGVFNILISPDNLKNHDYDNVVGIILST